MKAIGRAVMVMVLVTACASMRAYGPGKGVTPELSEWWGCSHQGVMELAAEHEREKMRVPSVGMNACVVLAAYGAPYDVDLQQSDVGRGASWWYKDGYQMHLVRFKYVEDLEAYYDEHWDELGLTGEYRDIVEKAYKERIVDKDLNSHWLVDYVGW